MARPAETDLLTFLHKAIKMVEDHTGIRARKDANAAVDSLLRELVAVQDQASNDKKKAAIRALVDFLSSDVIDFLETGQFPTAKWRNVRKQLETAWPRLVARTRGVHFSKTKS